VQPEQAGPSLLTRFLALVVLVVAAWVLLKLVLGVLAGLATGIAVVVAIVGIVWALGKF
jgi:hypothetical protein